VRAPGAAREFDMTTIRTAATLLGAACLLVRTASAAQDRATDPRDTLVLANRILAMEGLTGPFGHVSVRADAGSFWVADHRSPDSVERAHLKQVSIDLTEDQARVQHWYREIFIHSETYRLLPDVGAVVHTHAPNTVALGTLALTERLRPTTNLGANLGEDIPIYEPTGLVERPDAARVVARTLGARNAVLLRGHGAVIVGASVEEAVLRAIYLEQEARYQLVTRAAGTPRYYTAEEAAPFSRRTAIEHAWQYYLEKLKRTQASGPGGR
jgi:HCOMODA/2-hydroxy-3-carboxy-muconic semialdehyde decarboxylase